MAKSKGFVWGDTRLGYAVKSVKIYNKYTKKWDTEYNAEVWTDRKLVRTDTFNTFDKAHRWCLQRAKAHYKGMTPLQARKAYL